MSDRVLQTNVLQQGESMLARTLLTSIIFMSAVSRTSVYGTNEQLQKEKKPVCSSGTFYISGFIHNDRVTDMKKFRSNFNWETANNNALARHIWELEKHERTLEKGAKN